MTNNSGDACTPSGPCSSPGASSNEPRFLAAETTRHLGIAGGPQDDDCLWIPGPLHRGAKSFGDGQHGHEYDHHARDTDDRDGGGPQSLTRSIEA